MQNIDTIKTYIVYWEHYPKQGYYWRRYSQGHTEDSRWSDAGPESGPFRTTGAANKDAVATIGAGARNLDDSSEFDPMDYTTAPL